MKKIQKVALSFVLILGLALSLSACGSVTTTTKKGGDSTTTVASLIKRDVLAKDAGLKNELGTGKLYVTALGQADRSYMKEIVDEAIKGSSVTYTYDDQLKASSVEEGSVVIAVVGYTSKGISGDITQTGEVQRAKDFSLREDIYFVLVQLSGSSRRGESTDPIIEAAAKSADLTLLSDSGDGKGADYDAKYSTTWCKGKPLFMFSDEWNIYTYIQVLVGVSK